MDLPHTFNLPDNPIIVFDGECVLCSRFFHFVLKHDKSQQFRFIIAQSDLGEGLYQSLNLPTDDYETNLVIVRGQVFQKADAFAAVMRELGGPWRIFALILHVPHWLKNPLYSRIARNRYRIWGRHDQCMMPDDALRSRFLDGGLND
ncbi:thiol-disulfide oxidoreductase DCC family protein [Halocynthiibacter namhaensis]|uniref:thiol-disulfide oxidoreductase DCC family protein n=1 Tax=Halocynthiibacter namhaensis TaxID=1290553 RepID=UPI000578E9B9|nr:DCC1-like thiol-disulfide oxidoreductase family protein [Halocynthiibacter namhaensis]